MQQRLARLNDLESCIVPAPPEQILQQRGIARNTFERPTQSFGTTLRVSFLAFGVVSSELEVNCMAVGCPQSTFVFHKKIHFLWVETLREFLTQNDEPFGTGNPPRAIPARRIKITIGTSCLLLRKAFLAPDKNRHAIVSACDDEFVFSSAQPRRSSAAKTVEKNNRVDVVTLIKTIDRLLQFLTHHVRPIVQPDIEINPRDDMVGIFSVKSDFALENRTHEKA